jgi:hypothetical protein
MAVGLRESAKQTYMPKAWTAASCRQS